MFDTPLISIIVPVYNVERYLSKCLDSLIQQTYTNIEIICVNDGSKDGSEKIINKYLRRDDRVKLINKKNQGVSKARNTGINYAKGKYIMFVDADDWVDTDTCEKSWCAMRKEDADVVLWSYVSENNGLQSYKNIYPKDKIFNEEMTKRLLHRRFVGIRGEELAHPELADSLCPVWGKLYKASLIKEHNIQFVDLSEIGTYEDGLFNLEVFLYVKKAVYLNKYFYHYRRDNENSITSKYNMNLYEQWQRLFDRMEEYIKVKQLSDDYVDALNNRIALSILGLGLNVLAADMLLFNKMKMLKNIVQQERYKAAYNNLELKYFPIHWKVFYFCAKHGCSLGLYCTLYVIERIIS